MNIDKTFPAQNNNFILAYIVRCGLYFMLLYRLKELENNIKGCSRKDYLPIDIIYQKICRNFNITKKEARVELHLLESAGYLSFVKYRGIKLNYQMNNGEVIKNVKTD